MISFSGKQNQVSSSGSTSLPINRTHNSCSSTMESKSTVLPVSLPPAVNILTRNEVLSGNAHGL
jgi:hypothetical protein